MKSLFGILIIGCYLASCFAQPRPGPAPPGSPSVNNNNVDSDGNDPFQNALDQWNQFRFVARIPPWALVQRSPWGSRVFFKRSAPMGMGPAPAPPSSPAINNNNVDSNGNDLFQNGLDQWNQFRFLARIPPWALVQRSPWGSRIFFKRALENQQEGICIFNSNSSVLSCAGPSPVECQAQAIVNTIPITTFSSFAISATPIGDLKHPESLKFSLFARKLDKTGWKHSKIRDSARQVHEYSLFSSLEIKNNGIRVTDNACWNKLVSYLTGIKQVDNIKIGTPPNRIDDAKIVGKIFIDKLSN